MRRKIFSVFILLILCSLSTLQCLNSTINKDITEEYLANIKIRNIKPTFLKKSPEKGLKEALRYYGVKHPDIVYAQAVLETGYFKSGLCNNSNNLFGLYNSKKKKYYTFNHWKDCIVAYKEMIQYKYKGDNNKPPNDYYKFLSDIGYAKDPHYIKKLKRIVNDKRRSTRVSFIKD